MSIITYTGKTGSGKTFQAVKHEVSAQLKEGGRVFSNIRLYVAEHFQPQIFYYRNLAELIDIQDAVIFMDEAQILINARLWENLPPEFIYKVTQHRKHRVDLVTTTQEIGQIDVTVRNLIHQLYKCEAILTLKKGLNPFSKDDKKDTFFHLFRNRKIDMDSFRSRSVDETTLKTLKSNIRVIHPWSERLYNTYEDIGFEPYKMLCSISKIKYKKSSGEIVETMIPAVDIMPNSTTIPGVKPQGLIQKKPMKEK